MFKTGAKIYRFHASRHFYWFIYSFNQLEYLQGIFAWAYKNIMKSFIFDKFCSLGVIKYRFLKIY